MKKCGVPFAWKSSAVSASASISAACACFVDRRLHLVGARARRHREPYERFVAEVVRVVEHRVVHRPERRVALLGAHLERRFGRGLGPLMERERLVLEDEAQLVAVVRAELAQRRLGARAEGALVVRELDDRDERARRAPSRARRRPAP